MSAIDALRRTTTLRKEVFRHGDVLDIGCGGRKRGSVGVDVNADASADVLADGTELPFTRSSFDAVICYHLIEHLRPDDIMSLLFEIRRVLRSGGRAHLLVDRDVSRQALLAKDPTHVDRYTPESIREAVASEFDIDVFQTHNLLGNVHNHPLSWWRLIGAGTKVYVEAVKP